MADTGLHPRGVRGQGKCTCSWCNAVASTGQHTLALIRGKAGVGPWGRGGGVDEKRVPEVSGMLAADWNTLYLPCPALPCPAHETRRAGLW